MPILIGKVNVSIFRKFTHYIVLIAFVQSKRIGMRRKKGRASNVCVVLHTLYCPNRDSHCINLPAVLVERKLSVFAQENSDIHIYEKKERKS